MGQIKLLIIVMVSFYMLAGCSGALTVADINNQSDGEVSSNSVPPIIVPKKPAVKIFDPLDGKNFTFSARNVPVQTILYTIAMDTGLNLIISPDVKLDEHKISANFINTPIKETLEIIMELADIYYEVKGNILRISKYKTNIYSIPYITSISSFKSSLGGDLIGAADRDGASNLKGEFTMQTNRKEEDMDFLAQIEKNINSIASGDMVNINRLTGIISVRTTFNKMQQVEEFLNNAVENSVRQVQIEARIMEVTLKDEYSYGVDWTNLLGSGSTIQNTPKGTVGTLKLSLANNFQGIIQGIATYGKIDTLSNPRLTVLSGQNAMISAGKITPYWEKELKREDNLTTITYTKYNVLDGLSVGLTAFVNDDDTVMLNIIPITSSISEDKDNVEKNEVIGSAPEIEIKEASTMVLMENEATLVIGGLISNSQKVHTTSVPILGSIPILGYLFSQDTVSYEKKELVIIIKPTVVKTKTKVVKR